MTKSAVESEDTEEARFADLQKVIVLDVGHTMCRVGWAHEAEPRSIQPPTRQGLKATIERARKALQLRSTELVKRHPMIITMSTDTPLKGPGSSFHGPLHTLVSSALTELDVPLLCVASSATAIMRSEGHSTGMVVELTAKRSICIPVYEGNVVRHAIRKFERVTGEVLDDFLATLIVQHQGIAGDTAILTDAAPKIKAQLCRVALQYDAEVEYLAGGLENIGESWIPPPERRRRPSGVDSITVNVERITCPEALFKPNLMPKFSDWRDEQGLPSFVVEAIQACDPDIRRQMAQNVVLAGAGSGFPGLRARMQKELSAELPNFDIVVSEVSSTAAWRGAAMLATSPIWPSCCVVLEDYEGDGLGPQVVDKMFN